MIINLIIYFNNVYNVNLYQRSILKTHAFDKNGETASKGYPPIQIVTLPQNVATLYDIPINKTGYKLR